MLLNKIKVKLLQLMREVKMKLNLGIMDLEIKWKLFLLKVIQLKYLHFFIMNMMKKLGTIGQTMKENLKVSKKI